MDLAITPDGAKIMKAIMLCAMSALLLACGPQTTQRDERAVTDYVAVSELEETDRIRTDARDGWELISDRFLLYKTRRQDYLVEFRRICHEIRDHRVVPDVRRDHSYIRARFDTLGGCQIDKIYALTEGQSAELAELGEAPGDRY